MGGRIAVPIGDGGGLVNFCLRDRKRKPDLLGLARCVQWVTL
jgi:hypothetical protein